MIRCPQMRNSRRKDKSPDWRLTMENIGRELRKVYRLENMPPRLRTVLTRLERKAAGPPRRPRTQQRRTQNKGESN
jgi:hypothetical protein